MNLTIDDLYQSIAQSLVNCIDEDWNNVTLKVTREGDDVIGYTGHYSSGNATDLSLDVEKLDDEVGDYFHNIYAIMTEKSDQHKWNRAIYKLTSDFKFSIDFEWDQALADEIKHYEKLYGTAEDPAG